MSDRWASDSGMNMGCLHGLLQGFPSAASSADTAFMNTLAPAADTTGIEGRQAGADTHLVAKPSEICAPVQAHLK